MLNPCWPERFIRVRMEGADTHNRYIYFYAETRLQEKMYWGGENFHWFEGKRFGFFKADFGNDSDDFTQSFSCD